MTEVLMYLQRMTLKYSTIFLHYDFSFIEKELGIDCFSIISDYKAIVRRADVKKRIK